MGIAWEWHSLLLQIAGLRVPLLCWYLVLLVECALLWRMWQRLLQRTWVAVVRKAKRTMHIQSMLQTGVCVCGCLWKIQKDVRTILVDQPPLTSKGMWHTVRDRIQRIYLVVWDAELISSAYLLDVDFLVAND